MTLAVDQLFVTRVVDTSNKMITSADDVINFNTASFANGPCCLSTPAHCQASPALCQTTPAGFQATHADCQGSSANLQDTHALCQATPLNYSFSLHCLYCSL
jgi:hypothetical protein